MFPATLPTGIGEFFGPNQIMNFVVPTASSQNIISAQAAYLVYGFPQGGPSSGVAPWGNTNADANIFQRGVHLGHAGDARRRDRRAAREVERHPGRARGGTRRDGHRRRQLDRSGWRARHPRLRRDRREPRAPSSSSPSRRPGRTVPGSPTPRRPRTTRRTCATATTSSGGPSTSTRRSASNGTPTNAQAANLVGYFDGTVAPPLANGYQDLLALEAAGSTVPDCAMHVKRSTEVGPMTPYQPATPCGCFWENVGQRSHLLHRLHLGLRLQRWHPEMPLRLLRGELR